MRTNLCSPLISYFTTEKGCQMKVLCTMAVIVTLFFGIILCLCYIDDYVADVMVVKWTEKKSTMVWTAHGNTNTEERGRGGGGLKKGLYHGHLQINGISSPNDENDELCINIPCILWLVALFQCGCQEWFHRMAGHRLIIQNKYTVYYSNYKYRHRNENSFGLRIIDSHFGHFNLMLWLKSHMK